MDLTEVLPPANCMVVDEEDKDAVVARLAARLSEGDGAPDRDTVMRLVSEREALATTMVGEDVALPHAVLEAGTAPRVALAVCRRPIVWHQPDRSVRIVILVVSGAERHLEVLRSIASVLRVEGVIEELREAPTGAAIQRILGAAAAETPIAAPLAQRADDTNAAILAAADGLRAAIPHATLVVFTDVFRDAATRDRLLAAVECVRVARDRPESIDDATLARRSQEARATGGGTIVSLSGEPGSDRLSTIRLISSARRAAELALPPGTRRDVVERVLDLADDLAFEGREGKPVGTAFVVGDFAAVQRLSHQLIVNPFRGYGEEARNVLDPSLEETIKEFAKIDGAILIRGDGVVEAAGAYLAVAPAEAAHRSGHGARHASALGITARTRAVAIVISESTRRVTVFFGGRAVNG